MRSPRYFQAFHRSLALSLVLGAGGCLALQAPAGEPCSSAKDCSGEDTACGTRACEQGVCKYVNVSPEGEKPLGQPLDDCLEVTCDGAGHAVSKPAPDQLPNDGSECTEDKCVEGTPLFVPAVQGSPCGKDSLLTCDGLGSCTGCTIPSECGDDGPCSKWSCASGVCIRAFEPAGNVVVDTVVGDCVAEGCDGTGKLVQVPYPTDAFDDSDPCTSDICTETGTVHGNVANGTPCETGCRACTDGVCGDCGPGFACDGDKMACIPLGEQPLGSICTKWDDCTTGFCVDGVCCESECSGKCMGCATATTGAPSGVCAPSLDGTNPDGDCAGADVCVDGTCRCENGVQDGSETKVDCGGACAACKGSWVCNGGAGCGAPIAQCCSFDCIGCEDQTAACFEIQSKECFIGEEPKSFTGGTFQDVCVRCNRMTCLCQ